LKIFAKNERLKRLRSLAFLACALKMPEIQLIINSTNGEQIVKLDGANFTVGRTDSSDLPLPDSGLSRRHATFEQHDGELWVFDENSTNGTFLNGEQISAEGSRVFDGDEIRLGDNTRIFVQVRQPSTVSGQPPAVKTENITKKAEPPVTNGGRRTADSGQRTLFIIAAALSVFIISLALFGVFVIVPRFEDSNDNPAKTPTPVETDIGVAIIDPLKNEDPEVVEALLEVWEVQEAQLEEKDVRDVTSTKREDLNVSQATWSEQRKRARAGRGNLGGEAKAVPPELASRGLAPQFAKMKQLGLLGRLPRDFTELARLRLSGDLTEMPLASKSFVLDQIGTSATGSEFTIFDPNTFNRNLVAPNSEPFSFLFRLAGDFEGQKYNLSAADDRTEFKRRLLRSVRPQTKAFIEEFSRGYAEKFPFPLLITSLMRSLEYQYDLTKVNSNATRAPNPPHASGYTFDMAFSQMSNAELSYVYDTLAAYEKAGRIDALFEAKNCIHIFVYPDGKPAL
jgi:pSer/pThr/pTyr-binding forkhead associated (FHA) protein